MLDHDRALKKIGPAQNSDQCASDLNNFRPDLSLAMPTEHESLPSINDPFFFNQNLLEKCQKIYNLRRHRERMFDRAGLFSDPAWDILLDLFSAHLQKRRVSISSAGIASCVPLATAVRYLSILENDGFVKRERDLTNGRRVFVSLTKSAIVNMIKTLENF